MDTLEAALDGDTERAPDALREFLVSMEEPPFAVDQEQLDLGARAIMRRGVAYALATRQSLFWGYHNGAAIKSLAWTGEMRQPPAALHRLIETGDWLVAVVTPGGVRPHAPGWKQTVRVRLLHARVRARLRDSGRWDQAAWGAPLNKADSAFTLLEFTLLPLKLLRGVGFSYTTDEAAAIYALWRYVGHLVGVPPDLIPADEHESERLLALHELTAGPPDQQSLELVRSLLDTNLSPDGSALEQRAGQVAEHLDRAVARWHLPAGYPESLRIAPTPAERLVPVAAAGIRGFEAVRRRYPRLDPWLVARNEALMAQGGTMLKERVAPLRLEGHGKRATGCRSCRAAARCRPGCSAASVRGRPAGRPRCRRRQPPGSSGRAS
jgi:hypothetical protein